MRKHYNRILGLTAMMLLVSGCGEKKTEDTTEYKVNTEIEIEEAYLSSEEDEYVPTVEIVYSEAAAHEQLADFLIQYYQIPDEYQSETRYYYNYIDLNDDGLMEIFAVVIGEYTERPSGDPAVILSVGATGEFAVIEAFDSIRTPVTISEMTTNGWHDMIYYAYGGDKKDGYYIFHYNPKGGYQTEISEIVDELEPVSGVQILSNNLIDDMDQGRYITLVPQEESISE